jgi:hypothetical protein
LQETLPHSLRILQTGRLRAKEAIEALGHLAKRATPALKRAALHALERIRKS